MTPRLRARRVPRSLIALACLSTSLLVASCDFDQATGPSPLMSGVLESGDVVRGEVGGTFHRVERYTYYAAPEEIFELAYRIKGDSTRLWVAIPQGDTVLVPGSFYFPGENADTVLRRSHFSAGPKGGPVTFLLSAQGSSGEYRLSVLGQNRKPETRGSAIQLDEDVDERLDNHLDADVYTFELKQPTLLILNAQVRGPLAPDTWMNVSVRPLPDTATFWWFGWGVNATPADTAAPGASSVAQTLQPGRYQAIVHRDFFTYSNSDTPVPYRFRVRTVNLGPEERSGELALGDTIASLIDYVGDVDDFVVRGTPGDTVLAFVEAIEGMPSVNVRPSTAGIFDGTTGVGLPGRPLLRGTTGRLAIPGSGALTLRVSGGDQYSSAGSKGRYRLFVYRPDTLPEGRSADLAFGEAASGTIAAPGDVDVYRLVVPRAGYVNVALERPVATAGEPPIVQVRQAGTTVASAMLYQWAGDPGSLRGATGRINLPAGTYQLRVASYSASYESYIGPYTLRAFAIDTAPETRPPAFAIGDTIAGESIAPGGDMDVFTFQGTKGDTVTLGFQSATGAPAMLGAYLKGPVDPYAIRSVYLGEQASATSPRVELPATGTYAVIVVAASDGRDWSQQGAYRATVTRFTARPETRAEAVAVGDTVREQLDMAGDVDGYLLSAPPGSGVVLTFKSLTTYYGSLQLEVFDPATGAPLGATMSFSGFDAMTPNILVPSSGRVRVRVSESVYPCGYPGCVNEYRITGGYQFTSQLVDRAPEDIGAAYAIGDTVQSRLEVAGDVDEFTFTAAAGDRLALQFDTPNGTGYPGIRASVVDAARSTTLATVTSMNPASLESQAAGFTVTTAGTYRLVIESASQGLATGLYRVRIARQP